MVKLELVSAPASEPITVTELKNQLRINTTDEDASTLPIYIASARQLFENLTNRAVITQTWRLHLDDWPNGKIYLPKAPLASLTHVKYYDTNEQLQTLSSSNYFVDKVSIPGRLIFLSSANLPDLGETKPSVQIQFVCGAASADTLVKQALLLVAGSMYETRENYVLNQVVRPLPIGFEAVVNQYKVAAWGDWNESI